MNKANLLMEKLLPSQNSTPSTFLSFPSTVAMSKHFVAPPTIPTIKTLKGTKTPPQSSQKTFPWLTVLQPGKNFSKKLSLQTKDRQYKNLIIREKSLICWGSSKYTLKRCPNNKSISPREWGWRKLLLKFNNVSQKRSKNLRKFKNCCQFDFFHF